MPKKPKKAVTTPSQVRWIHKEGFSRPDKRTIKKPK